MRLVVPAVTHGQLGQVDARVGFDVQRRPLQPVAAQHPLHGHPDIPFEHLLGGARTPRRPLDHLLDPADVGVVADTVEQDAQRPVGGIRLTSVGADGIVELCCSAIAVAIDAQWRPEQVPDRHRLPGVRRGVVIEARGETTGMEPGPHHRAATVQRSPEDAGHHPVDQGVR
ncbi:hypothetical protein BCA37_23715 [Mycobacterium sp. djl-10]|nr:hypothetical protein BCA37_23715 [Mycobacterium sp. djl-10]